MPGGTRFRAWYSGGATYDGAGLEDFKALPAEGVVWVTVFRDTGRTFYNGGDWYFWADGGVGYAKAYPWGSHAPRPEMCLDCVKKGVGVSDEEFAAVAAEAWAYHG